MTDPRASSSDGTEGDSAGAVLRVLLPLPFDRDYDYRAPPGLRLAAGDFVRVPLSGRRVVGVVWGGASGATPSAKLKYIEARLDIPPLPPGLRRFIDWVAAYTLSPRGSALKLATSIPSGPHGASRTGYRASRKKTDKTEARMTAARRAVLDVADPQTPRPAAELARQAKVSASVVRGLVAAGLLEAAPLPDDSPFAVPDPERPGPRLSPAQATAAASLAAAVAAGGFSVALLDGVTGSGKTEVYFEAIAAALRDGREVLVLLPEIVLTAQWLERFRFRFGVAPAQWHSELPPGRRRATWRAVAEGSARVVVGARSALFLPFAKLGLVVVDEEHDASYKQEDGVAYHARDMAVVRAQISACPVILSSATPSLETVANVEQGRYARMHLPRRHGGAVLPGVAAIDLRRHPPQARRWLSPLLVKALAETFGRGEQGMLFLNRRGYAPLTLCRACGHRLACPSCTAWLVEHRRAAALVCHHCGFFEPLPPVCPECGAADSLVPCGPGVERIAEEVAQTFPDIRTAVMTSDTLSGVGAAQEMVRRMGEGKIDLLIGTQIVAKGHHFPRLTLVGVVDADLGLAGGDLRAAERTYQLLAQVAGRAGRAERPGRALLQTHQPEHPVIRALVEGDRDRFLEVEAQARRARSLPPFGRLAALILSGSDEAETERLAQRLARSAPRGEGIVVMGPAPAPLALLRGRHRRRFLLKARKDVNLQAAIRGWLAGIRVPRRLRIQVDIDPCSFL
jgi:primosomal protein N' (replication factor Y)